MLRGERDALARCQPAQYSPGHPEAWCHTTARVPGLVRAGRRAGWVNKQIDPERPARHIALVCHSHQDDYRLTGGEAALIRADAEADDQIWPCRSHHHRQEDRVT